MNMRTGVRQCWLPSPILATLDWVRKAFVRRRAIQRPIMTTLEDLGFIDYLALWSERKKVMRDKTQALKGRLKIIATKTKLMCVATKLGAGWRYGAPCH